MDINFYILPPQRNLLPFVGQLTKTILQKSEERVLLFAPASLLEPLDTALWTFEPTSFVPHRIVKASDDLATSPTPDTQATKPDIDSFVNQAIETIITDNHELLTNFQGIVFNLTTEPLLTLLTHSAVKKLLEIITHDDINIIHGRQKYRAYQHSPATPNLRTFHI